MNTYRGRNIEITITAEGNVRVTQESMLSKEYNTMELVTDIRKINLFYFGTNMSSYPNGRRPLIQDMFPELTVDEREFVQTGCTPSDWENHQVRYQS
tara:strand:+ start:484 stop:774 length:291 start_codon:yes stop_codon:yes gene_type:complete